MARSTNLDLLKNLRAESIENNAVWAPGATGTETIALFPAALEGEANLLAGNPLSPLNCEATLGMKAAICPPKLRTDPMKGRPGGVEGVFEVASENQDS